MRRYRNIAQCKQVTDRFNLMMNLSDCVYDVIRQEYNALANSLIEGSTSEETISPEITVERPGKVPKRGKGEMNDYFKERFEKVKEMQKQRHGFRTIAKTLQMSRNTVRRYADMDVLPKKTFTSKTITLTFRKSLKEIFLKGNV